MSVEDFEFYDLVGSALLEMGSTYDELKKKPPFKVIIDGREVLIRALKAGFDANDKNVFAWRSTVYDAALQLYAKEEMPIPVLCHQEDMKPVGVLSCLFG